MGFGDWNGDGDVSPGEAWGTGMLLGHIASSGGDNGSGDGSGDGGGGGRGGCGCGGSLAFWIVADIVILLLILFFC